MKWSLDKDFVEDENFNVICFLPEGASRKAKKLIEKAPEMYEALFGYITTADEGSLPARKMYNHFKDILDDIPEGDL